MKLDNIEVEFEGKELWIIWMGQDHTKLNARDVKKLAKFLNRKLQTKKQKHKKT